MKRVIFVLSCFYLFTNLSAQYYVRGDHNGWGTSNPLLQRSTLYGGSTYATVLSASFDQEFKIANGDYSHQWAGGYWITEYNKRWTIGANGANAIWKGTPNSHIVVVTENPGSFVGQQLPSGIMTLSALPVGITSVSQIGTDQGGGNYQTFSTGPQTINITLSAAKSPEENIYLRYTTNNWASSNWVLATGSGTSYSAIIPGQANGTIISYYVLSTTLTFPHGDLEFHPNLMTINYNNNNGINFTYTINISLATSILSLEVIKDGVNDVIINWVATNNRNIDSFEVEFGQGKEFTSITKLNAGNQKEDTYYSFKHLYVPEGTNYYRVKMIDKDKSISYSKTVSVEIDHSHPILLPNPNNGQFTLKGLPDGKTRISIFDQTGKLILVTYSIDSQQEMNYQSLSPGKYFITLQNGTFQKSVMFQKF